MPLSFDSALHYLLPCLSSAFGQSRLFRVVHTVFYMYGSRTCPVFALREVLRFLCARERDTSWVRCSRLLAWMRGPVPRGDQRAPVCYIGVWHVWYTRV